ncbi:MAG: hypothetical protein JWR69_4801 [Pedosphaera sp.]|nr:hypothetical protein [Pedosphaera sp.]
MNSPLLHLKQMPEPVREPVAWFIAGADPVAWLEEICGWEIPQEKLRLFVLPRSHANRSVAGVLVVPPAGILPKTSGRAMAFGVVAGMLYLPVNAELSPPVEPSELKLLHAVQVFHPGIGLVGFDLADALKVSDLLRSPPSRVENWNLARSGVGFNSRLRSISVAQPVSLADLFGNASEEIGSDPIIDLPPAPDEPGEGPTDKLRRAANQQFNRLLASLLRQVPHNGLQRTWINNLEDWATSRLRRIAGEIESLRHKELNRLLHQLKENPELGLRHAIPLNQLAHRGLAPPGNRLGARTPDFNLGSLRGGNAADFWDIPAQLRQQLTARYRELANRELQLGRYRRAAYIFAELLGDLEAAASALKQGGHFREAAVVYQEHLRRPREAAVCLAEGGFFPEAIALYEKESCFLEVADLYVRLGQPDLAAESCRREVEKLLQREDRVGAAKLLEERLAAPDEALSILAEGWPQSNQAFQCLEAQFAFLARRGCHAQGRELLDKLRAERTRPGMAAQLVGLLSHQSSTYPDHQVRRSAADLVRIKASERLALAAPAEAVLLSDALVKLAPEDRLLARDAVRFVAGRNQQFRRQRLATPVKKTSSPILVRTFNLPRGFRWHTVKSSGACFYAAGYGREHLLLLRGDWEGKDQMIRWPSPPLGESPLLFEFDELVAQPPSVMLTPGPSRPTLIRLPEQVFIRTDRFGWALCAGTPGWLPDDVIRACSHAGFNWLLRSGADGLLLECRTAGGNLVANTGLSEIAKEISGNVRHLSLLVQRDLVWIAADKQLFLHRPNRPHQCWETESAILSLVGSAPHLPLSVLMRLERGVACQRFDDIKENVETICPELVSPLAAFSANGTLILLSNHEGRICDPHRAGFHQNSFEWPGKAEPMALMRAQTANEFAIFTKAGEAHLFRIQTT